MAEYWGHSISQWRDLLCTDSGWDRARYLGKRHLLPTIKQKSSIQQERFIRMERSIVEFCWRFTVMKYFFVPKSLILIPSPFFQAISIYIIYK